MTNLKGDDFPEYDTLLYQKNILFQTVQKKNQLEKEMLYFSHHNKVTRRTFWYKRFQLGKNSLKNQAFLVKFHFCNLPYSTLVWSTSVTKNSNLRVAEVMLFHYHRSALKKNIVTNRVWIKLIFVISGGAVRQSWMHFSHLYSLILKNISQETVTYCAPPNNNLKNVVHFWHFQCLPL